MKNNSKIMNLFTEAMQNNTMNFYLDIKTSYKKFSLYFKNMKKRDCKNK